MAGIKSGARSSARVVQMTLAVVALVVGLLVAPTPASASSAPAPIDASVAAAVAAPSPVKAADLSKFDPGYIISDAVFFNRGTMSEAQIQQFLDGKVRTCQSGYTCLKDYRVTTRAIGADAMCGSYNGGGVERAATIIFKVAQACGINPQVLLVMLEKEQSLVTHTWPSEYRFRAAMGQGCPDTAACDSRYYGLFNQLYGAAWQLKRYANPPGTSNFFTWYAPGRTWNVLFNPNQSCGSAPVYVRNQATSNLYYYTPYQPNAAALRAGYGTGDGCSSYGNRNFFNFFNDWFGSTNGLVVQGEMGTRWRAIGGAASAIGNPTQAEVCDWTPGKINCYQNFEKGAISWTPGTGAWETYGAIRERWQAMGFEAGVLGYPVDRPACGTKDGGCFQNFQKGAISWTPGTGAWETFGGIRERWAATGFENGVLGYPVSYPVCGTKDGGCYQNFQKGAISWTPGTGAWETYGAIRERWRATGFEDGALGYPAGPPTCGIKDKGCFQNFQGGAITSSAKAGTWETTGPLRSGWEARDFERGPLGYPTSAPTTAGGRTSQLFEGGSLHWSASTGVLAVVGAVNTRWSSAGGVKGSLGFPRSAYVCGTKDGGCFQDFERGAVSWSPSTGTWETYGDIRSRWQALKFESGPLGYPIGAPTCGTKNGGCYQDYRNGAISWSKATGAWETYGPIRDYWRSQKFENGALGYPKGPVRTVTGGSQQAFEGGTVNYVGGKITVSTP